MAKRNKERRLLVAVFTVLVAMVAASSSVLWQGSNVHAAGQGPVTLEHLPLYDRPYEEPAQKAEALTLYAESMDTSESLPIATEVDDGAVIQIRNHLASRPLAQHAGIIAQACKDTGMDPYWFCTIAIVESGGGANCFLPHNAWGYGQYSWSSWEEAIPSFATMFVNGYGSGLNASSHLRYCPGGAFYEYL